MLKQSRPPRVRRACGLVLVAVFGCSGGYAAWAAQASLPPRIAHADGTQVDAQLDISVGAETMSRIRLVGALGETMAVDSSDVAHPWHAEFVADSVSGGIELAATVVRDGQVVAQPLIVVGEGQPGSIEIGGRGEDGYLRLDATLFLRAPGWRPDRAADAGADHPASENASYRVTYPPTYPPAAIAARKSGHIELSVAVDEQGLPQSAEVVKAEPEDAKAMFGDASIATVMRWKFNPALADGRPAAGTATVPIDFRIVEDD